ncbi:MAG: conjugal transfer protein TraX [Clostridiales bacterium]|nr:conjugal transfer protein TraX [Clostridiales bacterium]
MTAFTLKIIATASMLSDHIGVVFGVPAIFRVIGRIAFPIYAYMIAQGCIHTKNINKYLLRLGVFAIISEIPYDMVFSHKNADIDFFTDVSFLSSTNIFYTLFLGACCIALYEKLKTLRIGGILPGRGEDGEVALQQKAFSVIAALPPLLAAYFLDVDYGVFGAGWIFAIYLAGPGNKIARGLVLAAGAVYIYWMHPIYYLLCALVPVVCVSLYDGVQGPKAKWAFYAFYPVHLAALAFIGSAIAA